VRRCLKARTALSKRESPGGSSPRRLPPDDPPGEDRIGAERNHRREGAGSRLAAIAGALRRLLPGRRGRGEERLRAELERVRAENARLAESEGRYRGLIETMYEGFVVVDGEERILLANRRFGELLRIAPDRLVGTRIHDYLDPANRERLLAESEDRRYGIPSRYELEWRRTDGGTLLTMVSAASLFSPDGTVRGSFAVVTDLTAQRRLEEQAVQGEKLRALGEMAGGIAHDFNNRLTAILGNAQLLLAEVGDERIASALEVIEESALESAETVRRMMAFTGDRSRTARKQVDPNVLVSEALELVRHRWELSPDGDPYDVRLDLRATKEAIGTASELREALVNVLANALDAMPDGGTLEIATADHQSGVELVVRDTGRGMSRTTRLRAFDPFFSTRGLEASGLGLSLAYGIVRRHNGRLTLASEEGRGTTVRFHLPVAVGGGAAAEDDGDGRRSVLLVSADDGAAKLLGTALFRAGIRSKRAADGAGARALLESGHPPGAVLVDLRSGGGWGPELARALRGERPRARLVVVRGADSPPAPDADLVLESPPSLTGVVERVDALLSR